MFISASCTFCRASIWRLSPASPRRLLGRNGVGKTTTLRAIMGLAPRSGGTIEFDGFDLAPLRGP